MSETFTRYEIEIDYNVSEWRNEQQAVIEKRAAKLAKKIKTRVCVLEVTRRVVWDSATVVGGGGE